jgi:fatty acid desaturase
MTEHYKHLLSKDELKPFLIRSNRLALQGLLVNYGLILLAFTLPALWFNPITLLASLILLGNRQLGLGILMHDCAHNAFFETKVLNQRVGEWLCAAPILAQFDGYRQYHLRHHAKAGTTDDPDYPNYQPYPIKPSSLRRKIIRDMTGLTGLKNLVAIFLMHAGKLSFDMSYKAKGDSKVLTPRDILRNLIAQLYQAVIVHAVMIGLLMAVGHGALYGLWWLAFLTTFQLFSRIRNAAEHANVPDLLSKDPRLHARTTYANWFERITVAPNHVNYHLEHHWIATVPPYRLADFHAFLKAKQVLDDVEIFPDYRSVIHAMTA